MAEKGEGRKEKGERRKEKGERRKEKDASESKVRKSRQILGVNE
jgi:hypothetical protein